MNTCVNNRLWVALPLTVRRFAPLPPMSALPAVLVPSCLVLAPTDSCARSSMRSKTASWYTSTADAWSDCTPSQGRPPAVYSRATKSYAPQLPSLCFELLITAQ